MVIEHESELVKLQEFYLDVETDLPEYVDEIRCSDGAVFTSRLFLVGSDFGIVVIMQSNSAVD